jgi:S1-C subfamily serine protease
MNMKKLQGIFAFVLAISLSVNIGMGLAEQPQGHPESLKSIVTVSCFEKNQPSFINASIEKAKVGFGQGVTIKPGITLTVYHTLLRIPNERKIECLGRAEILAASQPDDLLLLKTEGLACPVKLKLSSEIRVGEKIFTSGIGGLGKTEGKIEAILDNFIHITGIRVDPGDSGKPIFNERSEIVGLIFGYKTADPRIGMVIPAKTIFRFLRGAGVEM